MNPYIVTHLSAEEGLRTAPYQDHLGWWTIGIGHLIDRRKGGALPPWIKSFPITEDEAEQLLRDDIAEIQADLEAQISYFQGLSAVRQAVLLSMAFQMGVYGLLRFRQTLSSIKQRDFSLAAAQMLESRWAKQTVGRAQRLAKAMRTDDKQYLEGQNEDSRD